MTFLSPCVPSAMKSEALSVAHLDYSVGAEGHLLWDNAVCNLSCYFKTVKIPVQNKASRFHFEDLYFPYYRYFAATLSAGKKRMINTNLGQPEFSIRVSRKSTGNCRGCVYIQFLLNGANRA